MIPLVKPIIGSEEQKRVCEVLAKGELAQGRYVEKFEQHFAAYIGSKFAVAASSGSTALHIALLSLGVRPGDKIITTPFSFVATANAILYTQAVPVFSDIDLDNYNLSPEALTETLKKHPDAKGLIVVHLYGLPAPMMEIMQIANAHGLFVLEDCAQAHGASINGKKVGTFGDFGVFSFYPTKNMTSGEGGMLTTQVKELALKAKTLINHGQKAKYEHEVLGYNYRMTNIHAAIGLEQLLRLPSFNKRRQEIAARYNGEITNPAFIKPPVLPGCEHVYNQYTLRVDKRDNFIKYLTKMQIGYGIHYPKAIPQQPLYQRINVQGSFANACKAAKGVISIPVHPGLSKEEVDYIVKSLQGYSGD